MMITLTNARILTMDEGLREYGKGWIRIEGDRIAALGDGLPPRGRAKRSTWAATSSCPAWSIRIAI